MSRLDSDWEDSEERAKAWAAEWYREHDRRQCIVVTVCLLAVVAAVAAVALL